MKREWKPGDVGLWASGDGRAEVVYYRLSGPNFDEPGWQTPSGGEGYPSPIDVRPLVVIDPESDELVGPLYEALSPLATLDTRVWTKAIQAALRSLVAPPKPDEPMGLGAVVEDAEGRHWVRVEPYLPSNSINTIAWRSRMPNAAPKEYSWPNIAAVRVLSEGVA